MYKTRCSILCGLTILSLLAVTTPAIAQEADRESRATARKLESARLRLRLYRQVEYPQQLMRLDHAIRLTKAELESHRRRLREYEQFNKFSYSGPLFDSLEKVRLDVLATDLRLKELREERMLMMRFHSDRCRLYELQIEALRDQLPAR